MTTTSKTPQPATAFETTKIKIAEGCHIILVAQNKGGEAKSSSSLEVYLAATASGIPSILATLDQSNNTLAVALGDESKILSLDMGSANDLQRALNDAMDIAEQSGAILVIDTPEESAPL